MFIRDTAVAIVVGMVLLLLLSRLIGRVQFSLTHCLLVFFHRPHLYQHRRIFYGLLVCLSPSHRRPHCFGRWMGFPDYLVSDRRPREERDTSTVESGYSFWRRCSWRFLCRFAAHRILGVFTSVTTTPNKSLQTMWDGRSSSASRFTLVESRVPELWTLGSLDI